MAYTIDRLNSEDDTGRIEHLESELERVRNAFEEYISTTEGLEVDVKNELREMQIKLSHSTAANEGLTKKLSTMENLFKNLELTSQGIRENHQTEAKQRRQAEKALTETELELRSKIVKIRQLERIDSSALRIVDSGVITEMANNTFKGFTDRELEAVTDELISTQEKLRKAEEQLQRSQTLVQDLERNIQNIDPETAQSLSGDDKELLRELDEIRAEIDAARSDTQSQSVGTEESQVKLMKYESQLEESREENSRLVEEIACLRNILHYQGGSKITMDDKAQKSERDTNSGTSMKKMVNEVKEVHQFETKSLREQIEATLNENMALQEKVQKLEILSSSQKSYNEGAGEFDYGENIEVGEDGIVGIKFANDLTSTNVEDLTIHEKFRQTEKMLKKSQEECSGMRTEILALSESLYNANQSRGKDIIPNEEIIDLTGSKRQDNKYVWARNEVGDKEKEMVTLENNLISTREEVRLLSEEISYMTSAFEKAQDEYNSVVEELQQTENALAAAKDTRLTQETKMKKLESVAERTPQKDAEIHLLRTQFKKLSERNENLTRQVKDAMNEVSSVREKQDKFNAEMKGRVMIAKDLQDDFVQALSETNRRNREVEELSLMMENRMGVTERNIGVLDSEIGVAMKTLQTAQVTSLGKKSKPLLSTELRKDDVSADGKSQQIDSETNGMEDKEKEASVETSARQSVLERSLRLLEVSETVQKLKSISKSSHRTTIPSASLHKNSTYIDRNNSKHDELIQKVANNESLSLCSKENRELEAHIDVGVEERE